jgi:hypothetical protein
MPRLVKELIYPTCKLLAAVLTVNAILSIYAGVLIGSSPVRTFLDISFLESGLMMIVGGLAMTNSTRIEGKGSKILLGAVILFLATSASVLFYA